MCAPTKKKPRAAQGFTLLEILLVLVIFSITAAVVVPVVIGGLSTTETKAAAKKIGASLNLAKYSAIRDKNAYFVDVSDGKILIASAAKGLVKEVDLSKKISVTATPDRTVFSPRGGSSGGEYSVTGENGTEFRVRVSSSGQVKIEGSRE